MPIVRCLNESGIREFAANLQAMRNPALLTPYPEPRTDLLHDPRHSQPFPLGDAEVAQRRFANRRQFAQYIDSRFQAAGISHDVDIPGVWEWLTLFYFNEVCMARPDSSYDVKNDFGRYIVRANGGVRNHRHLLRDPYLVFRAYRGSPHSESDVVLNQPLHEPGDVVESICARERLRTSPAAMRVARMLFYDASNDQSNPITRSEGGLRHYCKFVQNLPTEFNLTELSEQTLLAMLPDQFRPSDPSRRCNRRHHRHSRRVRQSHRPAQSRRPGDHHARPNQYRQHAPTRQPAQLRSAQSRGPKR